MKNLGSITPIDVTDEMIRLFSQVHKEERISKMSKIERTYRAKVEAARSGMTNEQVRQNKNSRSKMRGEQRKEANRAKNGPFRWADQPDTVIKARLMFLKKSGEGKKEILRLETILANRPQSEPEMETVEAGDGAAKPRLKAKERRANAK